MISANRAVSTSLQQSLATRNTAKNKLKDYYINTGASGKTAMELERSWLVLKGGTGTGHNELWGSYLATKGFTSGNLKDRMKAFFASGTQV